MALSVAVSRLSEKRVVMVVPPSESLQGFYSRYFLVPKKSGEVRPILDLRRLKKSVASAKLSPPRRDAALSALSRAHAGRQVTALSIMRLLGLMAATHVVVPLGLLFMHRLQRWFARQGLDPRHHKARVLTIPRSVTAQGFGCGLHHNLLSLRALHIPESVIPRLIWWRFGMAQVDLFTSRENAHCEM